MAASERRAEAVRGAVVCPGPRHGVRQSLRLGGIAGALFTSRGMALDQCAYFAA